MQGSCRATKFLWEFSSVILNENCTHFRNLIEAVDNPKCSILLKLDFSIAFNSYNRGTMLNHVFLDRSELYNYTRCAYSKPSYPFYGNLGHLGYYDTFDLLITNLVGECKEIRIVFVCHTWP